jgi:hypothetical protein
VARLSAPSHRPFSWVALATLLALLLSASDAFAVPFYTTSPVRTVNEDAAYRYDIRTADFQKGNRVVSAPQLPG